VTKDSYQLFKLLQYSETQNLLKHWQRFHLKLTCFNASLTLPKKKKKIQNLNQKILAMETSDL